jgi:hypothetical protein
LQAAPPAAGNELLAVLEIVVHRDDRPAISPSLMGVPSRAVTMPTLSGCTG